jgi:hypothetical protein
MSIFRGNIENWIRLSEPDYYTYFIRAWIPFNAWYVSEMPQHNKVDKNLIRELQDNPNSKPKLRIISLLKGSDHESQNFKYHLAQLHINLEKRSLQHNNKLLTFSNIILSKNPIKHKNDVDKNNNKYKAEIKGNYFEALVIDSNNKTLLSIRRNTFDIKDLTQDIKYIGLKLNIRKKIYCCYEAIDPAKPTNLITRTKNSKEYILLHNESNIKFINDYDAIAKACIKVLYSLRCMLFHGEVDPTNTNIIVYQHAFYLLKDIVKELK